MGDDGMDEWGWEQLRPWLNARAELAIGPTRGRSGSGAALRSELSDADLRGADLRSAQLLLAFLSRAFLNGADLRDSDLVSHTSATPISAARTYGSRSSWRGSPLRRPSLHDHLLKNEVARELRPPLGVRMRKPLIFTACLAAVAGSVPALVATRSVKVDGNYYVRDGGVPTVTVRRNDTVR
jgi:hypothetical protein